MKKTDVEKMKCKMGGVNPALSKERAVRRTDFSNESRSCGQGLDEKSGFKMGKAIRFIKEGKIKDSKTIIGLLMWNLKRDNK